jgi:hypothetical protein
VFPPHYPTSVLLGCVDLIDCMHRDQFASLKASMTAEGTTSNQHWTL